MAVVLVNLSLTLTRHTGDTKRFSWATLYTRPSGHCVHLPSNGGEI
jgi:hypothetical protein